MHVGRLDYGREGANYYTIIAKIPYIYIHSITIIITT
jgi:hypothetical protein